MKPADFKHTVYPLLADIMDPDSLLLITHLEEQEKEFILQARTPRLKYLRAIYLKAMSYFRHSRFAPGDLPRLMRLKMAEQLDLHKNSANILKIHPVEKSRVVGEVRGFLNIKHYKPARPAKGRGLAGAEACPGGKQYTGPDQRDHQLVQGCCH